MKTHLSLSKWGQKCLFKKDGLNHLQESKVNFYAYWAHDDERYAIWFSKKVSTWVIGHKSDLGSDNRGIVATFGENKWPNNICREFALTGPRDLSSK